MSEQSYSCPKCGKELPGDKPWWKKDVLKHLYYGEKMSMEDIAELFGITTPTVHHWMEKKDVERRSVSASHGLIPPKVTTSKTGYERIGVGTGDGACQTVGIHRLIAVAKYGINAVKDKEVHHRNHIPWDNRPENIEIMDGYDHSLMHFNERSEEIIQQSREANSTLEPEEVKQIKELLGSEMTQREIAEQYDVSQTQISRIKLGKRWGHIKP